MGGPRLSPAEIEKRQKEKQRKSLLFKRIKQLLIIEKLKNFQNIISNYFVANISNLVSWLNDVDSINPINMSNEKFKRKTIDVVTDEEDVQVIEVVNVEDFPKNRTRRIKIDQTQQVTKEMKYYEILNYH
jgi:hypothetical protein